VGVIFVLMAAALSPQETPNRTIVCGVGKATIGPVDLALRWLARHQDEDGSWRAGDFGRGCAGEVCRGRGDPEHDVGVTGLSLLAFVRAGYTSESKDTLSGGLTAGAVMSRTVRWLLRSQDVDGCLGPRFPRYMYGHAVATQSLCEAYAQTPKEELKRPVQKALDFLVLAQTPGRGWRYEIQPRDNDTSITGWALAALSSGRVAGLTVPDSAFAGAAAWLEEVTDPTDGKAGYFARGPRRNPFACCESKEKEHETMTAVSLNGRLLLSKSGKDPAIEGVDRILRDPPAWKSLEIDFNFWYWASMALYRFDGPAGPAWKKWNEPLHLALTRHQVKDSEGCPGGSWPCDEDRWGFEAGRVYATAINALTLEIYYRYPNACPGSQ
jgi:hypothetical protein